MPKRLVLGSIRLSRETVKDNIHIGNGQFKEIDKAVIFSPEIGKVFDFKQEELDYLNEHAPRFIRHPRNDEIDNASTVTIDTKSATDEGGKKVAAKKAEGADKVDGAEDI
jgi:hypothetical protein